MIWDAVTGGLVYAAGRVGDILGVASLVRGRREERSRVSWEVYRSYLDVWERIRAIPGWEGIADAGRDLGRTPRTAAETDCVRMLLVRLALLKREEKAGRYDFPNGAQADLAQFFALPVNRDAWSELRRFHDPETVEFIERAIASRG